MEINISISPRRSLENELNAMRASETSIAKLDDDESEADKRCSLLESECRKLHETKSEKDGTIENLLTFVNKIVQSGTWSEIFN